HDRIDRVYQRHGVGTAFLRGPARRHYVRDIWRELDDHGQVRNLFHPLSNHARIFRHLPHRGTHSALTHTMRTAEIQLESIAAGVLRALCNLLPCLLLDSTIRLTITA